MAFQVEANEYRGETKLQVQVQAVRARGPDREKGVANRAACVLLSPSSSIPYGKDFLDRT